MSQLTFKEWEVINKMSWRQPCVLSTQTRLKAIPWGGRGLKWSRALNLSSGFLATGGGRFDFLLTVQMLESCIEVVEFINLHILVSYTLLSLWASQSLILKQCVFTYCFLLFKKSSLCNIVKELSFTVSSDFEEDVFQVWDVCVVVEMEKWPSCNVL